jgi:hypothetical protein
MEVIFQILKNLTCPTNVRKQVLLISSYFTTIPVGGCVGGEIENKANSVQFQVKLPAGTEFGKITRNI